MRALLKSHTTSHPTLGRKFCCALLIITLWCALSSLFSPAFAQEESEFDDKEKIQTILILISNQVKIAQQELDELNQMPQSKRVKERKQELLAQLDGLNRNFEAMATQMHTEDLLLGQKEESDWIKQLEALTLPLLDALSDVTEKPRKLERLKKRIHQLEEQLEKFKTGNENIQTLLSLEKNPDVATDEENEVYIRRLQKLDQKYDPRFLGLQLEEAKRTLAEQLQNSESMVDTATRTIRDFFKHRGLNLLITVSIFIGLWWSLMKIRILFVGKRSLLQLPAWMSKVLMTAYGILVLVVCIISSMVSLYILNDWLLLSVVILFLAAVVWASRQLIPRLFQEVRLALNLGTVKENERLVWSGVPWMVETIGLQATLINERLEGGSVLLPVGMLIGEHSRPIVENEPWFPTELNDWVILSDGTYGQVSNQSLEQVFIKLKGGASKRYATSEFLAENPINITSGFRYVLDFRLDHRHRKDINLSISEQLKEGLRTRLSHHFEGQTPDFIHLVIEFDHASEHALNLKIIVHVDGRLAEFYEETQREIQIALLDSCNEHDLTIPFSQVMLHFPEGDSPSAPWTRPPE